MKNNEMVTMLMPVGREFDNSGKFLEYFLTAGLVKPLMTKDRGIKYVVAHEFAIGWERYDGDSVYEVSENTQTQAGHSDNGED